MSSNTPHKTALGLTETAKATNFAIESATISTSKLRDAGTSILQDKFWSYAAIDRTRWNQLFPYRLAVYRKFGNKGSVAIDEFIIPPFTLPINPEALTISTPFAITTVVTQGGIVEEHNGAPLKLISLNGTTGLLPLRGAANPNALAPKGAVNAIFAGTLTAASRIGSILANNKPNVVSSADIEGDVGIGSGYVQFKLLERFLEAYVALKKRPAGKDYILAFEMWKDQAVYLVSPVLFDLRRSVDSAFEYTYALQFKGWRRVLPDAQPDFRQSHSPIARDPNRFTQAVNLLAKSRQVLEQGRELLTGIRADINYALMTPLRECTLFMKTAIGLPIVATDLPASIISDLKEPILETLSVGSAIAGANQQLFGNQQNAGAGVRLLISAREVADAFSALSVQSAKAETGQGRGSSPTPRGNTSSGLTGSPAERYSDDPDSAFAFFSTIQPAQLNLRVATQLAINKEKQRVSAFKREDFEARRALVTDFLNEFEASVGLGNATFTTANGMPAIQVVRAPTREDYNVLFAINEVLTQLDALAASSTIARDAIDSMEFFAGLATKSGIAFNTPASKFLVPFPYGSTLEQLSLQYLGTPDRWHEIAALNGLQSPYVDEEGFIKPLLTVGNDNDVTVANASGLYVGQYVWVGSTLAVRTKRKIQAIQDVGGYVVVSLDGDSDLAQYSTLSGAYLQAFLPNTVNSQQSIYIPSQTTTDEDEFGQKSIPNVDSFDILVRAGGVDLLLDATGDLVVTPSGDTRLSVGLTNIVQKVKLAISTPRGSLIHHQDYGFPLQVGDSTADTTAKNILRAAQDTLKGDPTFSGVETATILVNGPVAQLTLSVGIAGVSQLIPITIQVPR